MRNEPRIRDVYGEYQRGRIPFDAVIRAADEILANYQATRTADESNQPGVTHLGPGQAPQPQP